MRKSGLGRGLDALLPPEAETPEGDRGYTEIPIGAIEPNPNQPRKTFDDGAIAELGASIAVLGILQPLLVRRTDAGGYELVAGERRLRAARRAGLERVPVVVVATDERGSLERALVENIHRSDLNPIEEAAAYRQLLDEGGLTHEALGRRVGRNRATIANSLRLLELPVPVQRLLVDGRLSAGHGKVLLALNQNPFQERLARRAADEELSVRATEDLVRRYGEIAGEAPKRPGTRALKPPEVSEAQRTLARRLQTRVRVDFGRRKGRIIVDFVSLEELDRLVALITSGIPAPAERVGP